MNSLKETEFKSLANSLNKDGLDWSIISVYLTKRPIAFEHPSKFCLCREIAYLNMENKVYQVGKLYVPTNRIRNIIFFIRLAFSRKTFGHFITKHYKDKFKFNVIESSEPTKGYNILFNPNALIRYSKRVVEIKKSKFKFYVEEEFEVS
jgi:hypothetical protein